MRRGSRGHPSLGIIRCLCHFWNRLPFLDVKGSHDKTQLEQQENMGKGHVVGRVFFSVSVILLLVILPGSRVNCYYCDHDLCSSSEQYCCGDNLCCNYANSSSYIWITILVLLLILFLIWGLMGILCLDESEAAASRLEIIQKVLSKVISKAFSSKSDDASTGGGGHHHHHRHSWTEDPESSLLTRSDSPSRIMDGSVELDHRGITKSSSGGHHHHPSSSSASSPMSTASSHHQMHYHHGRHDSDVILP